MNQPELKVDGYFYEQNRDALHLWGLLSEDRNITQGPTAIPTPSITDICRSFDATRGVFMKIKLIEKIYYSSLLREHSNKLKEIKEKSKNKNTQVKGLPNGIKS